MFNDLNNANSSAHPAVDDIFAETDRTTASGPQSDIETRRVGLAVTGENLPPMEMPEPAGKSKSYLKILVIIGVVVVILGGAYFTYSQFIKTSEPVVEAPVVTNKAASSSTPAAKPEETGFVSVIPGIGSTTTVNPTGAATTSAVTTTEVIAASSTVIESTVDSDSDGLSDAEEKIAGTNINVIDTDNDGLSDYEEIKIYHTNPLNADTDSDTYLDGVEVKGGYNPNGTGKLSDVAPQK